MFLNKQKINLVIFLGFLISIIISNNYLNSYDKTSSNNNSHLMIKESIGGDWYKAQEIKEKKDLSWFNSIDYYKPYLPSRIIYFYYKILEMTFLMKMEGYSLKIKIISHLFYIFKLACIFLLLLLTKTL